MIVRALLTVAAIGFAGLQAVRAEPIDVGHRRELFVDHYLVDTLDGVRLKLHEPRPAEVAIRIDRPWEDEFAFGGVVIKDGSTYRMYYRGRAAEGKKTWCYAESPDGIRWVKPNLGLIEVEGTRNNNVVVTDEGKVAYGLTPFLDTKPGTPPSERLKGNTPQFKGGAASLFIWVSADGFRWRKLRKEPVFSTTLPNGLDANTSIFWSESEERYLCYFRHSVMGSSAGPDIIGGIRAVARTTSKDLLHWTEPELMTFGDAGTKPPENLYTHVTQSYFRAPHIYVAMPARFMPGRRVVTDAQLETLEIGTHVQGGVTHRYHNDCSDGAFMTSRGGSHFDRTFMEVFVRPGIGPENWTSRTNYPLQGIVPTGPSEMSIYVTRHYPHKSWHVQRCTLRTDGFASVNAPYAGGEMITKPCTFSGKALEINFSTSAAGGIRVEIQDGDGGAIRGFALADCPEIIGDRIERVVAWKGGSDVSGLAGQPVRLRFVMKDADLYSIRFRP